MRTAGPSKPKRGVDSLADAAMPFQDQTKPSERPAWWWVFFMPGKIILWIEYMFPRGVGGVFGSARRRNVPLLQILYSIFFYIAFGIFIAIILSLHPLTR